MQKLKDKIGSIEIGLTIMETQTKKLDWIDALKAFALLGILLNHAVESFQSYPWFSNPSSDWPDFAERMSNIFPKDGSFFVRLIQFLGWLGDMGPGVFIFLSGLTLTLSALNKPLKNIDFYKSRALRIYPLYISIHLIVLIIAILFFKWGSTSMLLYTPLSILGLRFTNILFGFLNPSWWFIWLILQLYLLFPFLLSLLKNKGIVFFLGTTFIITILSRISGILGYTFTGDLYSWMTGLFAGTRLFEFSFGMYFGFLLQNKNIKLSKILSNKSKLLLGSIVIYLIGFMSSWTYIGSILSNILITIGLSGIFYAIYKLIVEGNKTLEIPLLWIGKNSFSVFLLHQPFMIYFGSSLNGYAKSIALVVIIIGSFVTGHYIEKLVIRLFPFVQSKYYSFLSIFKQDLGLFFSIGSIISTSLLSFLILWGKIGISKYIFLIYFIQASFLLFYRLLVRPELPIRLFRYLDVSIFFSIAILLLNWNWMPIFGFFLIFAYSLLFCLRNLSHWPGVTIVLVVLTLSISMGEFLFRKYKPIEVGTWGEFPALQVDSETVYSLIPNKLTHLKYNNYDYFVKTNSLGFASPEIDLTNKSSNNIRIMILGDAFSMPEGLEYEFSYPALLEKKLQNEFPEKTIHVINAGVTGYGPIEEQAQLKKYIDIIKPDIIINQLFINEFDDINYTKESKLIGIGLKNEKIYKRKFLSRTLFPVEITSNFRSLLKLNNDKIYRYNKSFLFLYEKKSALYCDTVIAKMNSFLSQMSRLSLEKKAKYIVLGVPGQIEVSDPKFISYFPYSENLKDSTKFDFNLPLKIFHDLCMKNNIPYWDSKNYLKNYTIQPLYFEESWHWNKAGHIAIAELLFAYLKDSEDLKNLENNNKYLKSAKN